MTEKALDITLNGYKIKNSSCTQDEVVFDLYTVNSENPIYRVSIKPVRVGNKATLEIVFDEVKPKS